MRFLMLKRSLPASARGRQFFPAIFRRATAVLGAVGPGELMRISYCQPPPFRHILRGSEIGMEIFLAGAGASHRAAPHGLRWFERVPQCFARQFFSARPW